MACRQFQEWAEQEEVEEDKGAGIVQNCGSQEAFDGERWDTTAHIVRRYGEVNHNTLRKLNLTVTFAIFWCVTIKENDYLR